MWQEKLWEGALASPLRFQKLAEKIKVLHGGEKVKYGWVPILKKKLGCPIDYPELILSSHYYTQ